MIKTQTITAPSEKLATDWFQIWFLKNYPQYELSYLQVTKLKGSDEEWIVQYEEVPK
jgi:hypothetical protein